MTKQQMKDVAERVIFTAIEGATATGLLALAHFFGVATPPDEVSIPVLTSVLAYLKTLIGVHTGNGTAAIGVGDAEHVPATAVPAAAVILPEVTQVIGEGAAGQPSEPVDTAPATSTAATDPPPTADVPNPPVYTPEHAAPDTPTPGAGQ